jgi:hypothetical protein
VKQDATESAATADTAQAVFPANVPPSPLDAMAAAMVGDGRRPNLFFVSDRKHGVCAVFAEEAEALQHARAFGYFLVEDRLCGEFWSSEESDRG